MLNNLSYMLNQGVSKVQFKPNIRMFFGFFMSFFCFTFVFFSYPKVFFYYFSRRISTPFFITDGNVLAAHYFSSVYFFAYLYYFVFFWLTFLLVMMSFCSLFIYDVTVRVVFMFIYGHFISAFFNHLDFSDFSSSMFWNGFTPRIESIDFSSYITQYKGFFWDFFTRLCFFYVVFSFFLENTWARRSCMYRFDYNTITHFFFIKEVEQFSFWVTFRVRWIFRFFARFFTFYFFCGEGRLSDSFVRVFSIICTEIAFVIIRSFFNVCSFKLFNRS